MSVITAVVNGVTAVVGKLFTGTLSQKERAQIAGEPNSSTEIITAARRAAAESAVLLENRGVLPFAKAEKVAVFGRIQFDCFPVGYGSGGDVNYPYIVNFTDGLRQSTAVEIDEELAEVYSKWIAKHPADHGFWGHWPRFHPEMPLDKMTVEAAAARADTALVVIGRSSGEDRENKLEKGSWLLTDDEIFMLDSVVSTFKRTAVIFNCGSIIDMSHFKKYSDRQLALLYVWQGGMECGNAAADVLTGKVCPCGRLADTIADSYDAYPSAQNFGGKNFNNYAEDIFVGYRYFETFAKDRVLYPFGFGISYSEFQITTSAFSTDNGKITITALVKNVGSVSGKETLQLYYSSPSAKLGKAAKSLAAFAKTGEIAPGGCEEITLSVLLSSCASYDDAGKTGFKSAYVLEAGDYCFFIGKNVRDVAEIGKVKVEKTVVTEQLSEMCPVEPENSFERLHEENGAKKQEAVPTRTAARKAKILAALPEEMPFTTDRSITFSDVREAKATVEDFVAQLSDIELEALCRGDYTMNSPLGAPGNAAVCGGVLKSLCDKGVPSVTATDGPSGIRLAYYASLLPIGTALACTWNPQVIEELYSHVSAEMLAKGSDILLAPGMNIHRDPLCGRNFEYFSEDPLLSGECAAAFVTGVQSKGLSACPKHFACNSQETKRCYNDSRVSERALREIYLKGFEICIKKAKPKCLMSSYNKLNGIWSHYNYELCTGILRDEWGFEGCVMTDWWMRPSKDPDFPLLSNNAYRVRSQVDLLMPGAGAGSRGRKYDKTLLDSLGREGGITKAEIQRSASNVLRMILSLEKELGN